MNNMLGVMFDCSRNAVMSVEAVKRYADILKKMGYNTIMLYTEDTYEVDNQPLFGYMRGRYTKAEMKEIDDYCYNLGIEVVPCIQTLAHLNCIFKWPSEYGDIKDCNDILLVEEEKTEKLLDDMLSTLSECFRSRKIHIGMDEAGMVGLGQYKQKHGLKDRFDIINNHLHRVCEIASKYNYEPMIWSDMFCNLALGTFMYDSQDYDLEKIKEKAKLPENVTLVYWDYYSRDYENYDNRLKLNKAFGNDVVFAGGAWTWKGFMPDNGFSIETTNPAIRACNDNDVKNVFFTVWGDDGAECSKFSVLPALMYGAEIYRGNTDMESIKKKFKEIVGADFDAFMILDEVDKPGGQHNVEPNKYLLYNDIFTGINDYRCTDEDEKYYENLANKIADAKDKGDYQYLFDTLQKLCEVFSIKANLGNKIRNAYVAKDIEALRNLVDTCTMVIERVESFHETFQKQWFIDNKPFGFDIQDIRLGGLIQRLKSCRARIIDFVDGKISKIPELDEKIIESKTYAYWSYSATPNVISHIF